MKQLLLSAAALLFLGILKLPMGYYTLLRIVVTIAAFSVVIREFDKGSNTSLAVFGIIGILFNPLIPVYLHDKSIWLLIDIAAGIIFMAKALTIGNRNVNATK